MEVKTIGLCLSVALVVLSLYTTAGAEPRPRVTVAPEEIDDVLYNPGMGFMTQMAFDGEVVDYPKSTLVQWDWYWDEMEPESGHYRWDLIDEVLAKARAHGQQVAIRIMPVDGRGHVPQWYRDLGAKGWDFTTEAGPRNWMPDHNDPLYVKYMGRLVREFGKRFDGNPDIAFVDIRSLGHWGEWHFTFVEKELHREVKVDPKVRRALVDMYLESFHKTPLVMLIEGGDELSYAVQHGTGWRADCFGDLRPGGWNHMFYAYQQELDAAHANDAWKHAPVVLEACGVMQEWADRGYDIAFILSEGLRWHCSAVQMKSSPVPPEWWPAVESFLKRMGYRLVLRHLTHPAQAAPGGLLHVETEWENKGVAPPYRNYQIAFRLCPVTTWRVDPDELVPVEVQNYAVDVRKWLPGIHQASFDLQIPKDLAPGRYRLSLALLDPYSHKPAVQLAIKGRDAQGWYNLSEVKIAAPGGGED